MTRRPDNRVKFDLQDAHVYGGVVFISAGSWMLFGPGAALLTAGITLWYMGVYRMRRL